MTDLDFLQKPLPEDCGLAMAHVRTMRYRLLDAYDTHVRSGMAPEFVPDAYLGNADITLEYVLLDVASAPKTNLPEFANKMLTEPHIFGSQDKESLYMMLRQGFLKLFSAGPPDGLDAAACMLGTYQLMKEMVLQAAENERKIT